jgi:hypothetical protein
MKKLSLIISFSALIILMGIMGYSAVTLKALSAEELEAAKSACTGDSGKADDWVQSCCNYGIEMSENSKYRVSELDTEEIMTMYHKHVNDTFNENVKKMITGLNQSAGATTPDPNNIPPDIGEECTDSNYSTFCVAKRLLSGEEYGYLQYAKALECKKHYVFDTEKDEKDYTDYVSYVATFGDDPESKYPAQYQVQKTLQISDKLEEIDREIIASKQALDTTLATYDELKTAWLMHTQYMAIYKSLLKYRDKLVEIRHHVEEFPSKFIDVTTTACT